MFTPNHSSFNHSDSFQEKTPIYIRVYISLSLSLSYAGARTFIRGVQKNLGPRERAQKGARAGPEGLRDRPQGPTGSPCAGLSPQDTSWEPPGGEKRPCGALRAKGVSIERPGRRGENREGGATPAEEGAERPGTCPGRPQEAPVQPFPPWILPLGPPGKKNGPAGLSGKNGGTAQGKTQQETCPREGKSSKGRGAGRKPPKTRPHWRSEARRAPFRGPQAPLSPPASRNQRKRAEKGPGRPGAPQRVPVTPQPHAGMVLAARRRERDGRDAPLRDGPGGKNKDTPGPSARRPRAPDGSHHEGRRPAGPAGQPAI